MNWYFVIPPILIGGFVIFMFFMLFSRNGEGYVLTDSKFIKKEYISKEKAVVSTSPPDSFVSYFSATKDKNGNLNYIFFGEDKERSKSISNKEAQINYISLGEKPYFELFENLYVYQNEKKPDLKVSKKSRLYKIYIPKEDIVYINL